MGAIRAASRSGGTAGTTASWFLTGLVSAVAAAEEVHAGSGGGWPAFLRRKRPQPGTCSGRGGWWGGAAGSGFGWYSAVLRSVSPTRAILRQQERIDGRERWPNAERKQTKRMARHGGGGAAGRGRLLVVVARKEAHRAWNRWARGLRQRRWLISNWRRAWCAGCSQATNLSGSGEQWEVLPALQGLLRSGSNE